MSLISCLASEFTSLLTFTLDKESLRRTEDLELGPISVAFLPTAVGMYGSVSYIEG